MSQLSQALHGAGLLGSPGQHDAGLLGTLQTILGIPAAAVHGQLEQWRNVGPAWQAYYQHQRDLQNWQAQDPRRASQPQDGGVTVGPGAQDAAPVDPSAPFTPPASPPPSQGVRQPGFRDLAPWLQQGALLGAPGVGTAAQIGEAAQPTYQPVNGVPMDTHTGEAGGPRIGVNLQNVNGFARDTQDPNNANQFTPQLAQGEEPLYDQHGNITAVRNISGAIQSLAEREGTTAGARTANSVINGTGPDGRPFTGYAGSALGTPPGLGGAGGQAGGVISGQSPADQNYNTHTAENAATRYNGYIAAGQTAGQQIIGLQGLNGLLAGYDGNPASPAFVQLSQFANSFGVHLDPHLTQEQAAQSIARGMALQLRNPASGAGMPGSMSNQDRNYLESMVPGLAMTAQGRAALIDAQTRMAQRQQFVAQAAQRWNDHYGRIDAPDSSGRHFEDYVTLYNQRNRIFPAQRTLRPPGVR